MKDTNHHGTPSTRTYTSILSKIAKRLLNDKMNKALLFLILAGVSLSLLDYHLIDQVNIILSSLGNKGRSNAKSIVPNVINTNSNGLRPMKKHEYVLNKNEIKLKSDEEPISSSTYCELKEGHEIRIIPSNILPYLDGHRSWSKYLHFMIYTKGVPAEKNAINFCDRSGNAYSYKSFEYTPPDISTWEANEKLWKRSGRFPSVEQRIKYYMGSHYDHYNSKLFFDNDNFNISAVRCKDILNLNDTVS